MCITNYIDKAKNLKDESITEWKYLRCLFLILICGLAVDLIRAAVFIFLKKGLKDAGSFCIAVTGIQATVLTLSIALMALVSGQMSISYMGVGFNDFLLNIKPVFFTQRRVLKASIIILVVAVFANILHCYGLVIGMFACTCMLIWISISTIYNAFSGSERIEKEIKTYIRTTWITRIDKGDIPDAFVNDWNEIINDQTEDDYAEWKKTFEIIFDYKFADSEGRIWLIVSYLLLCHHLIDSEQTFVRGVDMLRSAYMSARTFLQNNRDNKIFNDKKIRFPLFSEISYSLMQAIDKLPVSAAEQSGIGSLSNLVLYVNGLMWEIGQQNDTADAEWERESENIAAFHRFLGQYISIHPNRNENYWGSYLGNMIYWRRSFEQSNCIKEAKYRRDQEFILAMLQNGYTSIVEKYFYNESVIRSFLYNTNIRNSKREG